MKRISAAFLLVFFSFASSHAAEVGHYAGGLMNIRDFFVPQEKGFYTTIYNYYYQTGRVNDANGREVDSVTIQRGPGPGLTIDIQPDVDVYMLVPAIIWVSPFEFLGANYAAFVAPVFGNSSIGVALSAEVGQGQDPEDAQFGLGDWYFQPLWLGWHLEHWDFALGWGFYAPTGAYDTDVKTFDVIGDVRVESVDNIGFGFWTNQFQGAVAWYPWANKATALTLALTYEINSEKEDFHVTPGQILTLNWGLSQYLPLTKEHDWLVEIGPAGYDTWQVTSDDGRDASNGILDQVHAAGAQVSIANVPRLVAISFHYFNEFDAEARFAGHALGLTISKGF